MNSRLLKTLGISLFILFLFVVPVGVYFKWQSHPQNVIVEIEKGEALKGIVYKLGKAQVLRFPRIFLIHVLALGLETRIRTGEYYFNGPITPSVLLSRLLQGEEKTYPLTFIEGWNYREMAFYLSTVDFLNTPDFSETFLQLCEDENFIAGLGIDAETLEGYLFPETYRVSSNTTPEELIRMMVKTFWILYRQRVEPVRNVDWPLSKILTLASIIEKETGAPEERPLIASVFHRRLEKGIRLQSDPTVIYGLENFDGNLRKVDLLNPHLYNTYFHAGLPPGPIANPGLESLVAAVRPADTQYLYFVSKGDGTHQFSETIGEHNEAVGKYQLRK